MWIATVNIGLRKIILFSLVAAAMTVAAYAWWLPAFWFFLGIDMSLIGLTVYAVYAFGVWRRLYSFTERGTHQEVRAYTNFKSPEENYKVVWGTDPAPFQPRGDGVYTNNRNEWAYLDIVRPILAKLSSPSPAVLLLGGGEGSLVYTILEDRPLSHLEVVEISPQISHVARTFFLNHVPKKALRWVIGDAFGYLSEQVKRHKRYDLAIVDLFNGPIIPQRMYQSSFAQQLSRVLGPNGVYFINFGFDAMRANDIKAVYQANVRNFRLYRYGQVMVGTNGNVDQASTRAVRI